MIFCNLFGLRSHDGCEDPHATVDIVRIFLMQFNRKSILFMARYGLGQRRDCREPTGRPMGLLRGSGQCCGDWGSGRD